MKNKIKILFLCTGNSCRSQMAEGLTRHLKPDIFEPYSAGTKPHEIDKMAVQAMNEIGIDISNQTSKHLETLQDINFDFVITVCDHAHETCPVFHGNTNIIHRGFDDPPALAKNSENDSDALLHYRRVRDEIKEFIKSMPDSLEEKKEKINLTIIR